MKKKAIELLKTNAKHLCVLTMIMAIFAVAGANDEAHAFIIKNKANGLCLDGYPNNPNLGNGYYVYGYNCDPNNPYQQWDRRNSIYASQAPFLVLLRNRGTGLCLDAGAYQSGGNGARVYTTTCDAGNNYQVWQWTGSGSGSGRLVALGGGAKLDGANFGNNPFYPYMYRSDSTNDFQRWYLQ